MVIRRGDLYWADLGAATGSAPAKRRPVLVVQADSFNASRIGTVLAAIVTSNQRLAAAPGNVSLGKRVSGLPKDSVVNVSQIVTLDKSMLTTRVSALAGDTMNDVDAGLRLTLGL